MDFFNHTTIWQVTSGVLLILLVLAIFYIKKLKEKVEEERQKRLVPLLDIEIDDEAIALCLFNDSHCSARNIQVSDLKIMAKLGFEKHLILKFEGIDMLKPTQKETLVFKVFDGEHDITDSNSRNLVHHLKDSGVCIQMQYSNLDNTLFVLTVEEKDKKFIIKEVNVVSS